MTRPHIDEALVRKALGNRKIDEALIAKILADRRAVRRPAPIEVDQHNFDLAYRIFTYGIGLVALGLVVFAVVIR